MRRLALNGLLLLAAAGCATAQPEEVRKPFLPYQLAPQPTARDRATPALRRAETLGERAEAKDEGPAVRIDAALIRFAVDQRTARATLKRGQAMPPTVRAGWSELLGSVDSLLGQPARRTVPLDVVRARVALDAELDMDRDHYQSLPEGLATGVRARALALDLRLADIRKAGKSAKPPPTRLIWPIEPVLVTSLFGMRADPFNGEDRDHQGVDLKAYKGQLVQAAAEGTVIRSGRMGGYGLQVTVEHGPGLVTTYSHLSTLLVNEGTHVPARGPIGLAGSTGRSTGAHLHFEVWRNGEPVDPLAELPDPAIETFTAAGIGGY